DFTQNSGDAAVPHLSLHFGSRLIEQSLADLGLDAAALTASPGVFSLAARRVGGGAEVTVTIEMGGGAITVLDRHFVAGLELAAQRLTIADQDGAGNTMGLLIDDVAIAPTLSPPPLAATRVQVLPGNLAQPGAADRWQLVLSEPARIV